MAVIAESAACTVPVPMYVFCVCSAFDACSTCALRLMRVCRVCYMCCVCCVCMSGLCACVGVCGRVWVCVGVCVARTRASVGVCVRALFVCTRVPCVARTQDEIRQAFLAIDRSCAGFVGIDDFRAAVKTVREIAIPFAVAVGVAFAVGVAAADARVWCLDSIFLF